MRCLEKKEKEEYYVDDDVGGCGKMNTVGSSELGDGIHESIVELDRPSEARLGISGENKA